MRFSGKVCIVTGGGSGIGQATAMRLAAEGGRSAVVDIDEAAAKRTVELIAQAGGAAIAIHGDVSDAASVRSAVETVVGRWNRIDVVVNNAAMMTFKPAVELSEDEWDRVLAVNLRSVFLFSKFSIPHMSEHGSIINISSVHALETTPNVSPYVASKGAIEALSRALALELEEKKIRVNCVAPGAVDTPMLRNNPNIKSGKEKIEGSIGRPRDIAAAICFLASDEAVFVNGTTLVVDGGRLDIL
jgi:NAD(P)-dependent dehydrogenase (short-subunit alcohol dehydrogenase family)